MDVKKLSTGEMIIGISGIVLFFSSFLDWFGAEIKGVPGASGADNAWGFTLPLFAVLLGIAMVVLVALRAFGVVLPEKIGGFGFRLLYLLGGLAFLLVLLKIIVGPDIDTGGASALGIEVSKTREIGAYIGLLCTAGLAVGGFMAAKEAGDLDALMNRGKSSGGGATPPAPPAA
ncbi:MAG: hypothetical protein FJW95_14370 [Actinobacteria bacterium]|nr:hypothetical protein [Actinomycetota bacterium]